MPSELPLVTKSQLIHDLAKLGIAPGQIIMLHASVRAIGWIVGGPDLVLQALLDLLTPAGTLIKYIGWEDPTDDIYRWAPERRAAYLAECPLFDPQTSRANRKWSILNEYLRTRPGAYRSANPGASMVAIGAQARWLTENHPLQYGYGPGSPLAKFCEAGGSILMLGAPLNTITMLHYAEHMASVPNKRTVVYGAPLLIDGKRTWIDIEEFDTGHGIVDWKSEDYFPVIARAFLAAGNGKSGTVGAAPSYLFDGSALFKFAVRWMEQHLATGTER
ncbi:MAG: aminoglycoside 3-N-acetyltransferase [Chloroflexi bacterium]|nr:aminoglycoside 3-N-acetyltransferase [Chloroflexota bacterium]